MTAKVGKPTTFEVVSAEQSVAVPGPALRERPEPRFTRSYDMENNRYMNPTEFLAKRVPGYADLDADERQAVAEFSLLWPAVEGAILGTDAKPGRLIQIGITLRDAGRLDMERFAEPLAYFRSGYWRDGYFTPEYDGLHTSKYNAANRKLVIDALSSQPQLPEDTLAGLLLVVYRLRNNLFHGVKWAYGIRGQKSNFKNACEVLMGIMELYPT